MTIIQPNKNQDIRRIITLLGLVLVGIFLVGVFLYLQAVSLKHDLAKKQDALENLKVQNAELKNNFYGLIDANNLEQLASQLGLVEEKNPQWAFGSRY